jgi:hypothetical protein
MLVRVRSWLEPCSLLPGSCRWELYVCDYLRWQFVQPSHQNMNIFNTPAKILFLDFQEFNISAKDYTSMIRPWSPFATFVIVVIQWIF